MRVTSSFNTPQLDEVVAESRSYSEVMRKFGKDPTGGNFTTLRKYIAKRGLSTDHFEPHYYQVAHTARKGKPKHRELETIFCVNSTADRSVARKTILRLNLLPYVCVACNNTGTWLGKGLTLELDHVNGVFNDHRIANLRFLCPNCHSQTPTHCGKTRALGEI